MNSRDAADVACRATAPLMAALRGYEAPDEVSRIVLAAIRERQSNVITWTVSAMNRAVLVRKDDLSMLHVIETALSHMAALLRHRGDQSTELQQKLEVSIGECVEAAEIASAAMRLVGNSRPVPVVPPVHSACRCEVSNAIYV